VGSGEPCEPDRCYRGDTASIVETPGSPVSLRQAVPDNRQFSSPGSVAQVAKMTDSHEALLQDMHQESPYELLAIQPLGLQSGMIPIVLISEQDPVTVHRQQAPVTDGDSMSVASQITYHGIALAQAGPVFSHLFALRPGLPAIRLSSFPESGRVQTQPRHQRYEIPSGHQNWWCRWVPSVT